MTQLTIGLLGGSFNPPHAGHVHISNEAIKRLGLDQVWWLVSPQNPLKVEKGMLSLSERVDLCRKISRHSKIMVTDLEKTLPNHYSITTVRYLIRRYPSIRFVWIIGADNLQYMHRWKRWKSLFDLIPVLVYERGKVRYQALSSPAAIYFKHRRCHYRQLVQHTPPAWSLMIHRKNPLSSTSIRQKR